MRDGAWGSGPVRQVSATVSGLRGVSTGEVSVSRELPSSLPGQGMGGGYSAATGQVESAAGGVVDSRVGSPFSRRDWPAPGDRVAVDLSDGAVSHRVFTGQVDGAQSSLADNRVAVPLVDDSDKLSRTVSHEAVFSRMPPWSTVGASPWRYPGIRSTFVHHLAARSAGFFMTPPRSAYTVVDAPMVGGSWPLRGVMWSGGSLLDTAYYPVAHATGGAFYSSYFTAQYIPNPDSNPFGGGWSGGVTSTRPLNLTMGVPSAQPATSLWTSAVWGDTTVRVAVTSSRTAMAQVVVGGSATTVAIIPDGPWRFVTMRAEPDTESGYLRLTLVTDKGATDTGRVWVAEGRIFSTVWDRVTVLAPQGCHVHGVLADYDPNKYAAQGFTPSYVAHGNGQKFLDVLPAITSETAKNLLDKQATAECAAVWITEDGVLRWADHTWLMNQPVTQTLTSSQIADAVIESDAQDTRRAVEVSWYQWGTRLSHTSGLVAYEGPRDEYTAGDSASVIIHPPADEEWVRLDSTLEEIWGSVGGAYFSSGFGSWHGWTAMREDGSEIPFAAGDGSHRWDFQRIGPAAWKWDFQMNSLPTGANRVRTSSRSEESVMVKPAYRNLGLPLLRCMGIATRTEQKTQSVKGPFWAPDLDHDAGFFVQSQADAQALADMIATQLAVTTPRVTGLQVLADARIQLGDMITVRDDVRTGLSVTGVVCRAEQSTAAGAHDMTLDLRIKSITVPGATLAEFDDFYAGMTLSQLDTLFAGKTLAEIDSDPLRPRP